jgi:hypothetical protein
MPAKLEPKNRHATRIPMEIDHGEGASPAGIDISDAAGPDHPSRMARKGLLVVLREDHITGELADDLFDIMERSYGEHRIGSAFRYVYTREEFDEILTDRRIFKLYATLDGVTVGMLSVAMEIDAVQWISPDFFNSRHPGRTIYFLQDTFLDPDNPDGRAFRELMREGLRLGAMADAVVAFSTSRLMMNRRFVDLIGRFIRSEIGSTLTEVDSHTYFEFEACPEDHITST